MKNFIILASAVAMLTACSTKQEPAKPITVSPMEFKEYNCKQLAKEMAYTSSQYQQILNGGQTEQLLNTALAAYMVSQKYAFISETSDSPQAEYLKAKSEALHQASILKDCE